jgi:hypothetical protein
MVMELLMAVVSFIISILAGLAAGWIVYFILVGGLRMSENDNKNKIVQEKESLLDRFGVVCFRVANRFVISTLGGALVKLVLGKPKTRRA